MREPVTDFIIWAAYGPGIILIPLIGMAVVLPIMLVLDFLANPTPKDDTNA